MNIDDSKKIRVYLDTSVVSYLDQQDAPEKMSETKEVWDKIKEGNYEVFISTLVINELQKCQEPKRTHLLNQLSEIDFTILEVNESTVRLAEKFIDFGVLNDDIRRIRDYNASRHSEMSAKAIVKEIRENTRAVIEGFFCQAFFHIYKKRWSAYICKPS